MICRSSESIIKDFFKSHDISIDIDNFLSTILVKSDKYEELPDDIIDRIIEDSYNVNSEIIKEIDKYFVKKYHIYLGRVQKEQLKKYIDYGFIEDLEILISLIHDENAENLDLRHIIPLLIKNYKNPERNIEEFLINIRNAINDGNISRIEDYVIFLYSKLLGFNEQKYISLKSLFHKNEELLSDELSTSEISRLKKFCDIDDVMPYQIAVKKFNSEYIKILDAANSSSDNNSLIYIRIDQETYNKFKSFEDLTGYLFNILDKAFINLQNHKTLAIHIENIIGNNSNIKWRLYAYLTLYAEKHNRTKENRPYYHPEEICIDIFKDKFGIVLSREELGILKQYYKGTVTEEEFRKNQVFSQDNKFEIVSYLKYINHGFSFLDCYVLKSEDTRNAPEIEFIKNDSEILLVFEKHEIDDRKIPCPVCGSLRISGNSYPEIGIKSWECKDKTCFERSKSNRGKRYSRKSVFMQNATFDFSNENQIPRDLIKKWRKDVVLSWKDNDLYEMLVKYFTYPGDSITCINIGNSNLFEDTCKKNKRTVSFSTFSHYIPLDKKSTDKFDEFYDSFFSSLFIYSKSKEDLIINIQEDTRPTLILGDSHDVLGSLKHDSITNMVTSPPYYNAREYSQWPNLYSYLSDMYNINVEALHALIPGGVFFYNIGDIFDCENTIVKSTMGDKRIPLGAYTIFLFEKAGFELIDNVIWYKGEPQSNRQKNDGNFTPYYQRPANSYEHMFIFKKPGDLHVNSNLELMKGITNIVKFTPVIKIGRGGVNHFGHTAPFPQKIPQLSLGWFTSEGESVLDPFSGSGTTFITATQNNRKGIGIELSKEYANLSIEKAHEVSISPNFINKP